MAVEFLEGVSMSCHYCRFAVEIPRDSRPLHPMDAPVADMPREECATCGRPMLIHWRNVEVEEVETVA
jgi:hypothetical protein